MEAKRPRDYVEIIRGIERSREVLERVRIEKIRNSSIVRDVDGFEIAFQHAKSKGSRKPMTGLFLLRQILSKINP